MKIFSCKQINVYICKSISCFVLLFFTGGTVKSAPVKSELVVVNEMLFDIGGEAFTEYDYKLYKEVDAKFSQEQLSGELFSQKVKSLMRNDSEMFLFTRLVYKEAQQLEVNAPVEKQTKLTHVVVGEAAKNETLMLAQVSEYIGLKERLWSDRAALLSWLQVLKRKYDLNWKSYDFKKRTELGL